MRHNRPLHLRLILFLGLGCSLASLVYGLWILYGSRAQIQAADPPQSPTTTVYVALYPGFHASLLLPIATGYREYAYGEWGFYAHSQETLWGGLKALLWPTPATLGRRTLGGPSPADPSLEIGHLKRRMGVETLLPIQVDRALALDLNQRLDRFFDPTFPKIYNPSYRLEFVRHPRPYHLWHNCNHFIAEQLRQLGVAVQGDPIGGNFVLSVPNGTLSPSPAPAQAIPGIGCHTSPCLRVWRQRVQGKVAQWQ
ncbi:DUF2459 domain-containing protein [Lyngbya confervoides]|uniref:DUF2459 domain-containing protein n=1 Tax=Lyngbya confervoides BDU141951 TaxID=1574623 RepID=A0ABD4T0G0_9CYAN|nr:DUF2459 domain-containing protein [Lyngbya confervoides]MCM1982057.1 DUF2459 domain-containing protein [Lyngbya confervoides BDU141951]